MPENTKCLHRHHGGFRRAVDDVGIGREDALDGDGRRDRAGAGRGWTALRVHHQLALEQAPHRRNSRRCGPRSGARVRTASLTGGVELVVAVHCSTGWFGSNVGHAGDHQPLISSIAGWQRVEQAGRAGVPRPSGTVIGGRDRDCHRSATGSRVDQGELYRPAIRKLAMPDRDCSRQRRATHHEKGRRRLACSRRPDQKVSRLSGDAEDQEVAVDGR